MFCWLLLCFYVLNIKYNMYVSKYWVSLFEYCFQYFDIFDMIEIKLYD